MRTHVDIIKAVGSTAFARRVGAELNTVNQWRRNDSIPAPYWQAVVTAELATLEELAVAAEAKRVGKAAA